jgi:hypothetical protein
VVHFADFPGPPVVDFTLRASEQTHDTQWTDLGKHQALVSVYVAACHLVHSYPSLVNGNEDVLSVRADVRLLA